MSGKPYTISEFKTILDYLVENKLYGETRARKMWVDLANTKLTTRTWQSLKETFLKRILPDLHNPYFKLSNEQISSFKARYDISDRNKNKLEIHTISDDSNSNGLNAKDNEPTNNGNSDEGENTAGENIKCSKIPQRSRSSADTIIVENCYETAEDIQKDLESNGDKEMDLKPVAVSKSLRDCITYSEPLTPMLQEVLDDFASEPEDSENDIQMQIVENSAEKNNSKETKVPDRRIEVPNLKTIATDVARNARGLSAEVVEEVLAQELDGSNKPENNSPKKKSQDVISPMKNSDGQISSMHVENGTEKDEDASVTVGATKYFTAENSEDIVIIDSENTDTNIPKDSQSEPTVQSSGLNHSNSTVDASLPNNPEGLKNKQSKNATEESNISEKAQTQGLKATRKRSCSTDNLKVVENKKKKLEIKLKSNSKDKKPTSGTHKDNTDEHVIAIEESSPDAVEQTATDLNRPSTSFEDNAVDTTNTKKSNEIESPEIKNPCLQNVSLFDEQFNKTKYNMSESSDTEQNKKESEGNKEEGTVPKAMNDVVVLKSHTESENEEVQSPPKKKSRAGVLIAKTERDKAIANMFGFTSGGVGSKRRRQLSRRRRTISHNNASQHNAGGGGGAVSNSSDWTSDSESEVFVSPPRGRKNRPTRKYLKPHAGKILSLEEEGGLFVMYGKKIYPLIKDGKIIKNYVTYLPESDSEEGEAYWKLKYVEEKKKAEELKKMLQQAKEPQREVHSPVLQANPLRNSRSSHCQAAEPSNGIGKEICLPAPEVKQEETKVNPSEKIKIKFTKNNEEVHLEGHWPQIHPVLEQVVQIFHKEVEPAVSETKSKMIEPSKEPSSGNSTPIIITPMDPEIHEKVNKIEKEIFKEIEQRDREEEIEPNGQETNVTKRKVGRPRKSSSSAHSPVKQTETAPSEEPETKESEENRTSKRTATQRESKSLDVKETASKKSTRTPRKVLNETVNTDDSKTITRSRRSKPNDTSMNNDDEEVRYMFPPKTTRQSLRSPANKKKTNKSSEKPKMLSSPENFSMSSMDSTTQGYQDSDVSPIKMELRKKKKLDMSSYTIKTRNSIRRSTNRRSHPYLYCDAYNDSSNSSVDAPVKVVVRDNSSLDSEAYRSESYQHLMPRTKVSMRQLEPIDETSPIINETDFIKRLDSICKNEMLEQANKTYTCPSGQITSDVGSSSNVSLPMSPELSVVENMSILKDVINSVEDYPTINEMQGNDINEPTLCGKYLISDVDMAVPLMQQDCELKSCSTITDVSPDPKSITESLLSKIGTFNINEQVTATDTLDKKLHEMLLDSAKKIIKQNNTENKESMMEVDINDAEVQKKVRAKKRCSTPRKRKSSKKSEVPKVDPVVEEEHVESCSHSGRKSCPPLLQTHYDENVITEEINISDLTISKGKPKARKKKDIIKVKIQKPKNKKNKVKIPKSTKSAHNASRISVFTDSGINDTESELCIPNNDSVDLIHNHSETCLNANDCVGDSIEFIENSKSVITLGDSMQSGDNAWSSHSENNDNISPELFCNNAQDVSFYKKAHSEENTSDTVYHSPLGTEVSHNSLMTEDLSDDAPQPPRLTKWYLLSEDETNTNIVGQGTAMLGSGNYGSNLKQLFPITCAVPDLSTITEGSRENDNSRKPELELDGLTGDDFNSHSIFDSNF